MYIGILSLIFVCSHVSCIQSLEDLVKIKEIATGKYVGNFPNVPIGQYVRYRLALRMLVLSPVIKYHFTVDLAFISGYIAMS